jgi:hypothetical protein
VLVDVEIENVPCTANRSRLRVVPGKSPDTTGTAPDQNRLMKFSRACLIAAPLCFAGYGVVRLVGRMDGQYGPGLDWQVAHLVNLVGLVLFVPAVLHMRQELPRRMRGRTPWTVVTFVGVFTSAVQFSIDVVVGLLADDKAGMRAISGQLSAVPGVRVVFYVVGPPLMYVGLLALTIMLVRAGTFSWWSPALVLTGSSLASISLDLIPLGALCTLAALVPLALPPAESRALKAESGAARQLPAAPDPAEAGQSGGRPHA